MLVITSFSKSGYDQYGKKFLESFVKYWPCKVLVYYESLPDFHHEKVIYKNLFDIPNLRNFLTLIQDKEVCRGDIAGNYDYNFDIWKFCRKSFCQFDALKENKGKVIWLDADVVTTKKITEKFLENVKGITFLGREGFYTETGFIGFDTESKGFEDFLSKYEDCYRKGIIFTLKQWHDCAAFDWARGFKLVEENDLTPNWKPEDGLDVFSNSILSQYMTHLKGNKKYEVSRTV